MWRYQLFDWPLDGSEGDLETWCQRLADDGWRLWDAGVGAVIEHNGQMVRRISLRRDGRTYGRTYTPGPYPGRPSHARPDPGAVNGPSPITPHDT